MKTQSFPIEVFVSSWLPMDPPFWYNSSHFSLVTHHCLHLPKNETIPLVSLDLDICLSKINIISSAYQLNDAPANIKWTWFKCVSSYKTIIEIHLYIHVRLSVDKWNNKLIKRARLPDGHRLYTTPSVIWAKWPSGRRTPL